MFGAAISATNVPEILQIDLNANDFFRDESFPQYLYYNPYPVEKTITVDFPADTRLFEVNEKRIVGMQAGKQTKLTIPAGRSLNVVVLPNTAEITHQRGEYRANGILIAKDTISVSIVSSCKQRQAVSGRIPLQILWSAPERIKRLTITA